MPRQNAPHSEHPSAVLREIERLGLNITIARKRRGETQGQWASKLGVSQPTMARIERGDPSVAMASYVMCMWLINQADGLADLVAPLQDHAALEREVLRVRSPRDVRKPSPQGEALSPALSVAPTPAPGAAPPVRARPVAPTGKKQNQQGPSALPPRASRTGGKASPPHALAAEPEDRFDIARRILASAAKGNATAEGMAALLLGPRPKAR